MALTNGSIALTVVAISIFSFLVFAGLSRTCRSLVEVARGRSSFFNNFSTSPKAVNTWSMTSNWLHHRVAEYEGAGSPVWVLYNKRDFGLRENKPIQDLQKSWSIGVFIRSPTWSRVLEKQPTSSSWLYTTLIVLIATSLTEALSRVTHCCNNRLRRNSQFCREDNNYLLGNFFSRHGFSQKLQPPNTLLQLPIIREVSKDYDKCFTNMSSCASKMIDKGRWRISLFILLNSSWCMKGINCLRWVELWGHTRVLQASP